MENKYDELPVVACKKCLSLSIKRGYPDFCSKCGCTSLHGGDNYTIKQWKIMYKKKYGFDYVDQGSIFEDMIEDGI